MTTRVARILPARNPVITTAHFGSSPGAPRGIVGTALTVDGGTWYAVDRKRIKEFMSLARAARGH